MKLVSAGQLCNGCPAHHVPFGKAGEIRSSRPWPVAVPVVRGVSCRGGVVNVPGLVIAWCRVPITASRRPPAPARRCVLQMRRYAQTGPTAA